MIRAQRVMSRRSPVRRTNALVYYLANGGSDAGSHDNGTPFATFAAALAYLQNVANEEAGPLTLQILPDVSAPPMTTIDVASSLAPDPASFLFSYLSIKGDLDGGGVPRIQVRGAADRSRPFLTGTRSLLMFVQDLKVSSFSTAFAFGQNSTINLTGRVDAVNCMRVISTGLQGTAIWRKGYWDGRDLNGVMIDKATAYVGVQQASLDAQQNYYGDFVAEWWWRFAALCDGVAGHFNRVIVKRSLVSMDLTRSNGNPNLNEFVSLCCREAVRENTRTPPNVSNAQDFGQDTVASCTAGTIAGTTFTVGGTITGTYGVYSFRVGQTLNGTGVQAGTILLRKGTLANTWVVSKSHSLSTPQTIGAAYKGGISSTASTIVTSGGVTTVTFGGTLDGTPQVGQTVWGVGVKQKIHLKAQTGTNTWTLDNTDNGITQPDITTPQVIATYDWCDDNVVLSSSPTTAVENILQRQPRPIFHYPQEESGNLTGDTTEKKLYTPFSLVPRGMRSRDVVDFELRGNCTLSVGGTLRLYLGDWTNAANRVATIAVPAAARRWKLGGGFECHNKTDIEGKLEVRFHTATTPITGVVENIDIDSTTGLNRISQFVETPLVLTWQAGAGGDELNRRRSMIHFSVAQVSDIEFAGDEDGDAPEGDDDI